MEALAERPRWCTLKVEIDIDFTEIGKENVE
jgi:hypothetical protein